MKCLAGTGWPTPGKMLKPRGQRSVMLKKNVDRVRGQGRPAREKTPAPGETSPLAV